MKNPTPAEVQAMTPEQFKTYKANYDKAYKESLAYVRGILAGDFPYTDSPDLEKAVNDEWGMPGMPGHTTPESGEGDWRIVSAVPVYSEDSGIVILVTEECVGYQMRDAYCSDEGIEIDCEYYIRVAPGYRATRLRQMDMSSVPDATRDELDTIAGR